MGRDTKKRGRGENMGHSLKKRQGWPVRSVGDVRRGRQEGVCVQTLGKRSRQKNRLKLARRNTGQTTGVGKRSQVLSALTRKVREKWLGRRHGERSGDVGGVTWQRKLHVSVNEEWRGKVTHKGGPLERI